LGIDAFEKLKNIRKIRWITRFGISREDSRKAEG
jgi:hypothetical protein